jgi:hypothetical protein
LQTHPEMWKYYDGDEALQADYKSAQPGSRPSGASTIMENGPFDQEESQLALPSDPNGQIQYRSNGGPYGPNLPTYGIPLSSQPELTEDVKYPLYHTVRKHGKFQPPPQLDMNVPIMVNRRGQVEEGRSVADTDTGGSPIWTDFYGSRPRQYSESRRSPYSLPQRDPASLNYAYGTRERGKRSHGIRDMFSPWDGSKRHRNDFSPGNPGKRHIGPHDMDGIQRLISTG